MHGCSCVCASLLKIKYLESKDKQKGRILTYPKPPEIATVDTGLWHFVVENPVLLWLGGSAGWNIIPYTKFAGLVPCQGTYLGCRVREHTGGYCSMFVSLSLSLPPPILHFPLSLKINKNISLVRI